MRNFYTFCAVLLLATASFAQTLVKERKAVQVIKTNEFYLNGGNMATFGGGKSRTWFPVSLPPNTVEWYYSFSTSLGDNPAPTIDLFAQLTRLVDPSGATAIVTKAIMTPSGMAYCDTYLMDRPNADKFLDKADKWGGSYEYWPNGSRSNCMNGTVDINDKVAGTWCLGFKNPSSTQGIRISFEIVAIVEETTVRQKSEEETRAEMFAELGWKSYERGEYDKCVELSRKALETDPKMGWVHNNIGLVQLIKKDYIAAIESYSKAISWFKSDSNATRWFAAAIDDLNALLRKHGELDGARDMLELLQAEQRK